VCRWCHSRIRVGRMIPALRMGTRWRHCRHICCECDAIMGRIELANSIAAAARDAQQRGEHKEAAELFARALRVLTEGTRRARASDLWEQIRMHPPHKTVEPQGSDGLLRRYSREPK
jgi:hypothetical protein